MFRLFGLCCLLACLWSGTLIAAADDATATVKAVKVIAAGAVVKLQSGGAPATSDVRKDLDPNDPKERFLVLTPGGPIVVETTILVEGRPFRLAREELITKVIKTADADGDGKPTWKEAIANPRFGFGRFVYYSRNKAQLKAALKRYDRNQNGIVDSEDARYLVTSLGGGAAFHITQGATTVSQPNVKQVLDTDGDGVISQKELASAAEKLKSRDANDNDLLESSEVGGGRARNQYRRLQAAGRGTTNRPGTTSYLLGPTANLVAIFTALQAKYGGEDKAIQPGDFRWLPELVTELDLDKNGTLDSGEMVGLHLVSPHVVVEVSLGKDAKRPQGIRLVAISKLLVSTPKLLGNQDRVGQSFVKQIVLERPGMRLTLAVQNSAYPTANYARSAQALLSHYDTNKNGYIEKEELKKAAGQNQQYLVAQFERWDADADGKVYPKEIEASYLDQLAPRLTAVTAMASNQGPSFFNALDETGDNRISLREMKLAAKRLATFDKNGDGKLGSDEVPVEMSVTFSRGPNVFRGSRSVIGGIRRPGTVTTAPKGPDWFVRMDKNGDGDLTRREFLGGEEKFKQLDANSDDFIERSEAEAVELKSRR